MVSGKSQFPATLFALARITIRPSVFVGDGYRWWSVAIAITATRDHCGLMYIQCL
jgi:hypothetical protein